MIINLDLAKTYGQQNADIAKKNKINQIDMTINLYPESVEDSEGSSDGVSYGPITIDQNYDNLSEIKVVESKTNNNLDLDLKGFPLEYVEDTSDYFPTYYGIIKYKNYNISIDLSSPNYESLKYIDTVIPFISSFNGNRKYSKSEDRITFISNSSGSYSSISSSEIENEWSLVDIVNIFDNLSSSNEFYGITTWNEDNNFNNNECSILREVNGEYTTDTVNIINEITDIIQNGANNVSGNFLNLNNYIQPKINTWINNGSELEINISIPTSIYIFNSEEGCRYVHQGITTGFKWVNRVYYDELNIYKYNFTELNLSFAVNYTSETEQTTYYSGNYSYNSENSMLFTEGVVNSDTHRVIISTGESIDGYVYDKFYSENFADSLYDKYQNGKMQLSITYPVGHLQTINGLDVAYSEEYGLCTNIGNEYFDINGNKLSIGDDDTITNISQIPEGTLCYITKNGEIYYKNSNGSPKLFVVQTSNLVYNGILVNELTLIESSEQFVSAFNESSWAEIDAMGKIGILQDHLSVGEQKTISLASGQDITLSILDFNHDDLTDGSGKAGMTIGMDSRLTDVYQMNSTATTSLSWNDCTFRTQIIPQLITDLPSDLQSIIQPVIKYSATSNNDLSTVSASEDKLFLQSLTEITGPAYIQNTASLSSIFSSNEGEQYEYWKTVKDGTITEDRKKFNKYGQSVNWTTRSVSSETTTTNEGTTATFGVIDDNSGNIINVEPNTPETVFNNHGVSYAFCVGKQPFSFSGTLQDATWQQINYIANNGLAEQYFSVGDEKTITLSTGEEITLVILGFNHDNLADGSGKAGITFGTKELLQDTYQMSNDSISSTRWDTCTMYLQTLPIIFSQLPNDLQLVIKEVYKSTDEKLYIDSEEVSTVNSSNKLWLFSEVEIDGTQKDYYADEGSQYEYWKTVKDGTINENRIKYINNITTKWWLRSRGEGISRTVFLYIGTDGTITSAYDGLSGNYHGVSFGFCV